MTRWNAHHQRVLSSQIGANYNMSAALAQKEKSKSEYGIIRRHYRPRIWHPSSLLGTFLLVHSFIHKRSALLSCTLLEDNILVILGIELRRNVCTVFLSDGLSRFERHCLLGLLPLQLLFDLAFLLSLHKLQPGEI